MQVGFSLGKRLTSDSGAGDTNARVAIEDLMRAGMIDWSNGRCRASEEFRLVRRRVLRNAFDAPSRPGVSNLLMVTSARPGEGKSFTSINLAGSIAQQGDHGALMVDGDPKPDSVSYLLGLRDAPGLLDLLANPTLDPNDVIIRSTIDRLSVLPVGRSRERSAELFASKRMSHLVALIGQRFEQDVVVIDSSPCLSTSDTATLAPLMGQALFVVEADITQKAEIEVSLELIESCPTISLLLNKQRIVSGRGFGAYSSYYTR
jgi:protein-tyrosine kinase